MQQTLKAFAEERLLRHAGVACGRPLRPSRKRDCGDMHRHACSYLSKHQRREWGLGWRERSEQEWAVRRVSGAIWFGLCVLGLTGGARAGAQLLEPGTQSTTPNPLVDTTMTPGKTLLFDLEAKFAKDVAERGGAAFADWFAADGVALGNGAM